MVGTVYKEQSAFEAKRLGAPIAARNIARHLEALFAGRPRKWRPLVYCWRGGGRSDALAHVLAQIGWRVGRLEGGYKAYRHAVESRPTFRLARFNLGRMLLALGRPDEAIVELHGNAHSVSCLGCGACFERLAVHGIRPSSVTVAHARKHGARIVEGYPVEPRSAEMPAAFAWTGTSSAFRLGSRSNLARW